MTKKRYWLVNSGTTQDRWDGELIVRYRNWNEVEGGVQGFSRRPVSISVGDVLLHRAVGSAGNRIVALAEVTGAPQDAGAGRWPWRLPRRLLAVCPDLAAAPKANDLGIEARGVRTYKEISSEVGSRAAGMICAACEPFV